MILSTISKIPIQVEIELILKLCNLHYPKTPNINPTTQNLILKYY